MMLEVKKQRFGLRET